jgi:hypothetical protein
MDETVAKDISLRRRPSRALRYPESVDRVLATDVLPHVRHPFDRAAVVAARKQICAHVAATCAHPRIGHGGAHVLVLVDTMACHVVFRRPLSSNKLLMEPVVCPPPPRNKTMMEPVFCPPPSNKSKQLIVVCPPPPPSNKPKQIIVVCPPPPPSNKPKQLIVVCPPPPSNKPKQLIVVCPPPLSNKPKQLTVCPPPPSNKPMGRGVCLSPRSFILSKAADPILPFASTAESAEKVKRVGVIGDRRPNPMVEERFEE